MTKSSANFLRPEPNGQGYITLIYLLTWYAATKAFARNVTRCIATFAPLMSPLKTYFISSTGGPPLVRISNYMVF